MLRGVTTPIDGDGRVRVATFFEKLAHFLALAVKFGVVTTEAPQSKKLRECDDFLRVVDERTNVLFFVVVISFLFSAKPEITVFCNQQVSFNLTPF